MNRRTLIKMLGASTLLPGIATALTTSTANPQRRIILLELAGANDGLNTLVPWRNNNYYRLRPGLALSEKQRITLNDEFALHAALKPLMPIWQAGEMAIVHGLGYPQPSRSHFKSIKLWETGGDGNNMGAQGWITHDLEHRCAQQQLDACGISLAGDMGVFSNASGNWLSMSNASQFSATAFRPDPQASHSGNPLLQMLDNRASSLERSLSRIADKIDSSKTPPINATGKLAKQMQNAVSLINARVNTPVIKVSLDGFDTHENQFNRHQRLLRTVGSSIKALRKQLIRNGEWQNTVLVTYSEFGRTAAENNNGGTDHGTVAPHFVVGGAITGGFYGQQPEIPGTAELDMIHNMDYRALYSALLNQWLQTDTNQFTQWSDDRLQTLFQV